MKNIKNWPLILLGFFLPLHGMLTVFLPELRFWKEVLLGVLLLFVFISCFKEKKFCASFRKKLGWSGILALLFLVWLVGILSLQADTSTGIIAVRYLGLGFVTFLIGIGFLEYSSNKEEAFQSFSWAFLGGCAVSVLIGIWGQYAGGFEVLRNFYSNTISSWVPGQTIPLYHQVGEEIRMQGASSGPIEFAHLMLAGLFLILFSPFARLIKNREKWTTALLIGGLAVILCFGIFQSFSRATMLLAMVGMVYFAVSRHILHWKKIFAGLMAVALFVGIGICLLNKNIVQRLGDSEHFIRPLQAVEKGLESPLIGNLGELGPAARVKNLNENNDDRALVAENIFADVFAQMGVVGLLLFLAFWAALFLETRKSAWPFLIAVLFAGNMATIFDMTPISISFFLIFAFFVKIRTMPLKN